MSQEIDTEIDATEEAMRGDANPDALAEFMARKAGGRKPNPRGAKYERGREGGDGTRGRHIARKGSDERELRAAIVDYSPS